MMEHLKELDAKWCVMLLIFLACAFFFYFQGEREAAKFFFGMVAGQGASGGWTAAKRPE